MNTRNKKNKILFILPALTAGGAERVMITLMNGLDRGRFTPEFLTVSNEGPLKDLIDPSIPFHSLDCSRVSKSVPKLYRALKAIKPDIVITTMAHMNFFVLLLKPFFPAARFIVREAITPDFILQEHPRLAPFIKMAYRHLYKRADLVISPAQIIIDGFKKDLNMACKNHVVLPNPVDMKKIRQSEEEKFVVNESRRKTVRYVSAGRLHPQKGFDALIKALPALKLPYDWHWTIWGEGSAREHLERLIEAHDLQDNISLPGLSDNPWRYFTQSDCFLMPSRWEGLPNVILEALACGVPSIAAHSSGGIAEIADAAPQGYVNIVKDMNGFLREMEKIKPDPVENFRESKLPSLFKQEIVFERFESYLQDCMS